jgi:two-component system, OmpR family, sensor histidine kinase CiaH
MIFSYVLSRKTLKPIIDSYRKQTEFVQNASHELRTPLTIIQAKQELLLQEPEAKMIDKSEDINIMLKETKRLTKMIKELMMLAMADTNELKISKEKTNIDNLIKDITIPYKEFAEMQDKEILLELNYNREINVDPNKINQLMVILLDNAIKYTSENEKIEIKTFSKDGKCIIEVSDTRNRNK